MLWRREVGQLRSERHPTSYLAIRRMEAIRALSVRLDRTTIEHLDWTKCVDLYDRTETFFFFDPPYTDCNAGMYGAWSYDDVRGLRQRLDRLKGRWLVTMNDNPTVRQIFAGCNLHAFSRPRDINNRSGVKASVYRELVIRPA